MKKLLCLILALTMISSLLAMNVSAAELIPNIDFTLEEGEPEMEGWSVEASEGNSAELVPDPQNPDNMVMALTHDPLRASGGGTIVTKSFAAPTSGELVWMFDIMFKKAQSELFIETGLNGVRVSKNYRTEAFGVPNTWYSVIVHIEEGNMYGNLYRKKRDSEDGYERMATNIAGAAHTFAGLRIYTIKGKESSEGDPDVIYIDNCRLLSGLYMEDLEFMLDDKVVEKVSDIDAAGTLTARYNLMNADLHEDSTAFEGEYTDMLPAMIVFDKNGKMLDCVSYQDTMEFLDNLVELSMDTSDFYDRLDGGSVKLYLWDSLMGLQVLMDEVVLPAN